MTSDSLQMKYYTNERAAKWAKRIRHHQLASLTPQKHRNLHKLPENNSQLPRQRSDLVPVSFQLPRKQTGSMLKRKLQLPSLWVPQTKYLSPPNRRRRSVKISPKTPSIFRVGGSSRELQTYRWCSKVPATPGAFCSCLSESRKKLYSNSATHLGVGKRGRERCGPLLPAGEVMQSRSRSTEWPLKIPGERTLTSASLHNGFQWRLTIWYHVVYLKGQVVK